MLDENGYETDLSLCSFGPWEEINGETHEWLRKCGTCKNYQTTIEDPNKPKEEVMSRGGDALDSEQATGEYQPHPGVDIDDKAAVEEPEKAAEPPEFTPSATQPSAENTGTNAVKPSPTLMDSRLFEKE